MGNILARMTVVIGFMVVVRAGFLLFGRPAVIEPQTPIDKFPMVVTTPETGTWEGRDATLDAKTFTQSEVKVAVSRIYSKEGQVLKFFLAEYDDPSKGLYHNPLNCYDANGFTMVGPAERVPLQAGGRPDTTISLTTWERRTATEHEKLLVAYWYEVGDYTMYTRGDLLWTQWAMRGQTRWPMMFKVLLEMPVVEGDRSRANILGMAQVVREWLGSEHVKPLVN
jgi:EpsI family protein